MWRKNPKIFEANQAYNYSAYQVGSIKKYLAWDDQTIVKQTASKKSSITWATDNSEDQANIVDEKQI